MEPVCVGMGHDHCEWKIMPISDWGEEAVPYIAALEKLYKKGAKNG
jgi:hypothetical protein